MSPTLEQPPLASTTEKAPPEKVERFGQTALSSEDVQDIKGKVEATLDSDEPNSVYKAIDQLSHLKRPGVGGSVRLDREKLAQQREQLQQDPQTLAKYLVRMKYLGLVDTGKVAEVSEEERTLIQEHINKRLSEKNTANFAELCVSAKHLGIEISQEAQEAIRLETESLAVNTPKSVVDHYIKRRAQAHYLGVKLTEDPELEARAIGRLNNYRMDRSWDKYAHLQALYTRTTKQGLPLTVSLKEALVVHTQTLKDDPRKVGRYLSDLAVIEKALPAEGGVPEERTIEAAETVEGPVSSGDTVEQPITTKPELQEQERASELGMSSLANEDHPERNEDHMFSGTYDNGVLVAGVFDGMGGHAGGDIASGKALESVRNLLAKRLEKETNKITISEAEELVRLSLEEAQASLERENNGKISSDRMGTTGCVALVVEGEDGKKTAAIGNVGDSRAWVRRADGQLEHVTLDDAQWPKGVTTFEQAMAVQERLSQVGGADELANDGSAMQLAFIKRNRIAQYLGDSSGVEVGMYKIDLNEGDKLLITSDGVHDNLTTQEIQEIAKSNDNAQFTAFTLVDRAQRYSRTDGGRAKEDDMTAVVMRVGARQKKLAETKLSESKKIEPLPTDVALVEASSVEPGPTKFENTSDSELEEVIRVHRLPKRGEGMVPSVEISVRESARLNRSYGLLAQLQDVFQAKSEGQRPLIDEKQLGVTIKKYFEIIDRVASKETSPSKKEFIAQDTLEYLREKEELLREYIRRHPVEVTTQSPEPEETAAGIVARTLQGITEDDWRKSTISPESNVDDVSLETPNKGKRQKKFGVPRASGKDKGQQGKGNRRDRKERRASKSSL